MKIIEEVEPTEIRQGVQESHVGSADFRITDIGEEGHLRNEHRIDEDLLRGKDQHGQSVVIPRKGAIVVLKRRGEVNEQSHDHA